MVNQCPICKQSLDVKGEFCILHNDALQNLERQYSQWVKSYRGELGKEEYYRKLLSLNETGPAVKAVIRYVQEKEGSR